MNPRATTGPARPPRYPVLTPQERRAVESVWAAEQAGRPSRLGEPMVEVLTARGLIYVVHFDRRYAHLTARGAVVLDLPNGGRR